MHDLCGSLNAIGPQYVIGSSTKGVWLLGVGMALLVQMYHCGDEFWGFLCSGTLPASPLMPARCSTLSYSTTSAYIPPYSSIIMKMDWTIETISEPPKLNVCFLRVVMVMGSLHSNKILRQLASFFVPLLYHSPIDFMNSIYGWVKAQMSSTSYEKVIAVYITQFNVISI